MTQPDSTGESASVFVERESSRRLWSSQRCLVFFTFAVLVFVGIVATAFVVITIEPIQSARLVRGANGSYRFEPSLESRPLPEPPRFFRLENDRGHLSPRLPITAEGVVELDPAQLADWISSDEFEAPDFARDGVLIGDPLRLWSFARWSLRDSERAAASEPDRRQR